ncbi:hypothetical protein GCM10022235_48320 [Kribbella ginsengisoli]|uniref:Uncharacterized protein n=1 Tax=Kribbella ginsengisoli TaxID=363865 RepID=A0ABP6XVJ7_9ACTN
MIRVLHQSPVNVEKVLHLDPVDHRNRLHSVVHGFDVAQNGVGGRVLVLYSGRQLGFMSGEPAAVDLQALDLGRRDGLGSEQEPGQLLQIVLTGSAEGCQGTFGIDDVRLEFGTEVQRMGAEQVRHVRCVLVVKSRLSN